MSDSNRVLPTSATAPWCEVAQLGRGRFRLRLGGEFDHTWMASLCGQLTDHDLSIEQAHALRGHGASWLAELTLHADEGAEDPSDLPYLEWVGADLEPHQAPVRLRAFEVERVDAHGGTLCLTLEADDAIGLIGALLSRLAELHLYPVEMQVSTRAGHAEDRFWLSTTGGDAPTDAQRDELTQALEGERRGEP